MAKSLGLKTLLLPYEEGKEQAEKVLNENSKVTPSIGSSWQVS